MFFDCTSVLVKFSIFELANDLSELCIVCPSICKLFLGMVKVVFQPHF